MTSLDDANEIVKRFDPRRREVLFWACQGKFPLDIGSAIGISQPVAEREMTEIYAAFGFSYLSPQVKRSKLLTEICPQVMPQLQKEFGKKSQAATPPAGALPGGTAGSSPSGTQGQTGPGTSPTSSTTAPPTIPPILPRANRLLAFLVGILLVAVLILLAVIAWQSANPRVVMVPLPTVVTIAGAVITQTATVPQIVEVTRIVLVTPTGTPISAGPTSTQPPATSTPPAPTSPPPPAATLASAVGDCTKVVDMTGKVASEIPGTPLAICANVMSVVDYATKERDLYAIHLLAGRDTHFIVTEQRGKTLAVELYNPGSRSISTGEYSAAFEYCCYEKWEKVFTPAVDGIYYLAVKAIYSGQRYTLTINFVQ
jgi:hypothetical protein